MFSTGFNSGARAGSSTSVRLSGTTRSLARCHPARSISMTPWAPGATACAGAVDQAFRPASVEPHNPVPDGLQPDAADLRGFGPRAAIVDFGQRQQPPTLTRVPARFRQGPKLGRVIVRAKRNSWPHGEPPVRLQGI